MYLIRQADALYVMSWLSRQGAEAPREPILASRASFCSFPCRQLDARCSVEKVRLAVSPYKFACSTKVEASNGIYAKKRIFIPLCNDGMVLSYPLRIILHGSTSPLVQRPGLALPTTSVSKLDRQNNQAKRHLH